VVVTHNGREYLATEEMAGIFQRQAQRIIDRKASELVVLAHATGVELLPITSITPFNVGTSPLSSPISPGEVKRGPAARKRRGTQRGTPHGRRVTVRGTTEIPPASRPAAWSGSGAPDRTAMANVPLRIVGPGHRIATLQTLVVHVGDSTFKIQLDGLVIGFIRRSGHTFAALAGPDISAGTDWTHWNLWDSAATFLVHAADLAPTSASIRAAM
jgi:hypothetical protein